MDDDVVEGGYPARNRRRRRRAAATLILTTLLLFFAFWYSYSYYRADRTPGTAVTTTCPKPRAVPRATAFNVYNATDRDGLAGDTAGELRDQGFTIAEVANDPLQRTVRGVAELRHGKGGARAAKQVKLWIPGAVDKLDGRTDSSVDIVLGEKFARLRNPTVPPGC